MGTTDRVHALDATRAFALILGIVLHASMSFFAFLPAQDVSRSTVLAGGFFTIHLFRMSLFYVLAGFFARLAIERRGARAFVTDRAKRIGVPMTAGWLLLGPLTIGIVAWGISRSFPEGVPPALAQAPAGFPLLHLWFLYYLCIFYALALVVRALLAARGDVLLHAALSRRLAPLLLAAPTFAVLVLDPQWPLWFGVPTPDTGFTPRLSAVVAFGSAFALGWMLQRQSSTLLALLQRQWRSNLAVAVFLTAACLAIAGPRPDFDAPTTRAGGASARLAYAACYTLATWHWCFGLLGAALRFCSNASPVRRYLADASYWMYLAHLPVVFALQVLLMRVPLHWSLKFPLIVAIAMALLLASYHYVVRPGAIGELLNGRRVPRGPTSAAPALAAPSPLAPGTAVARLDAVSKRFGDTLALDRISLEVRPGELLAVLGPNGAGKSTAIGLWLGTLEPDAGVASVFEGSPFEATSRLGVGVMLQDVALAPELRAREHIALTASYYRDPLGVEETIALTGVAAIASRRYGQLSGGQKRQVQFAAAVCGRPRLLFLDEPTAGLDLEAREAMWRNIRALLAGGCSIVLTTHYLEEAEALADRVVVLAKGKVVADGSVEEMRALVARKRIRCTSTLALEEIRAWPGVAEAAHDGCFVHITAIDAEPVVRRLLAADPTLGQLSVEQATLADAFNEITREAA